MKERRMAFISAFIITTIWHELGHYLTYALLGGDPTLFHNHVRTGPEALSVRVMVITALAGPVFSLIQGSVMSPIFSRQKQYGAGAMVMLWLALLGFVNFFGYLMMTPLSTAGDTGKVADLLGLDTWLRVAIAVAGLVALIWIVIRVGRGFSRFIPTGLDLKQRSGYVYRLMFFPIMIGSAFNAALAFPAVAFLSIIYPLTSPYVIMCSFGAILKASEPEFTDPDLGGSLQKSLIILVLAAILVNRILTMGVG